MQFYTAPTPRQTTAHNILLWVEQCCQWAVFIPHLQNNIRSYLERSWLSLTAYYCIRHQQIISFQRPRPPQCTCNKRITALSSNEIIISPLLQDSGARLNANNIPFLYHSSEKSLKSLNTITLIIYYALQTKSLKLAFKWAGGRHFYEQFTDTSRRWQSA